MLGKLIFLVMFLLTLIKPVYAETVAIVYSAIPKKPTWKGISKLN